MSNKQKIIAMIPARMGSTRLKQKNLALLDGKPMIFYAINAAKESDVFDKIVINSESEVFAKIASRYGVDFYKRPDALATSDAKSDQVVDDFIENNPCDIVVWVNSIAPLQSSEEIKEVVDYFIKEDLDSLITVKDEQVHCLYKGRPLNFNENELFAKTQDLEPVQPFVYSIMMWKADAFRKAYEKEGHAVLFGKVGYYPVNKLSTIIIKREEDLKLAEYIIVGRKMKKDSELEYDEVAK